ncbi:MAG TPA: DUF4230 domain-containing protein [Candidatus Butyricicoccus avicola]|nr:DUF4230 domain-containing protein [Candidatus Butyricicoccus avicola]
MAQQQQRRKPPVRKTKKQIRRQRMLTVVGAVVVVFLIIFGLGALWGHGLGSKANAEDIASAITGLGQTVQVDYDYTQVLNEEDRDSAYYGWSQAADLGNFTILYQGTMDIGSDTAGVTADNVQIDGKAVTVTVPAISILSHEIAQDSISYYDSEDNQFRSIGAELTDFDGFCSDQKSVVENDVYNTDKFSNAEDRLRNVVSAVVKQMGNFDTVTVNFA